MVENQKYQQFNAEDYLGKRATSDVVDSETIIPGGIEDLLGDIDDAVTSSNISEEYVQTGGQ